MDDGIRFSAMRLGGERQPVVVCSAGASFVARATRAEEEEKAALVMGLAPLADVTALEARDWERVGAVPTLERKLRVLGRVPLVFPLRPRKGVRDISDLPADVRITRLWDRFSVDIGYALERTTKLFAWRIDGEPDGRRRTIIFEDGDRYAIRALCIFTVKDGIGYVLELLHDRSITGMRAALHLLGLALKQMSDDGASAARAISLPHSGSYALFALHAFFASKESTALMVKAGPDVPDSIVVRERWYVSYIDALSP